MDEPSVGAAAARRPAAGVSPKAVRAQLERILHSAAFVRSGRISRFLRFAVDQALDGRSDELKESLLGVEVFDREPSYDPRTDPIVRVEARRLRSKLTAYYEREGRHDDIVIEIQPGGYVPRFARRAGSTLDPDRSPPESPAGDVPQAIVVLPFTNLTPDQENEYFSDGLTEELIHRFTRIAGLRVVAWQSASQFKGKSYDLKQLGEQLKVDAAVGGSVRRSGDRLRVAAHLVSTSDGRYLWSEAWERKLQDVFAIQDEISRSIADTLRLKLVEQPASVSERRASADVAAYNLYLLGRFHWHKRTPDGLRQSIQLFEQAISADPALALGYAGLADAYSLLADYGLAQPSEIMKKARRAARRALAIDPTLAEAHTSLGFIRSLHDWRWDAAEKHYRKAIALNPGYATAHHWYAIDFLAMQARFEEARREMDIALRLDPLSLIINEGVGYLALLGRRYDEAIECYEKALELDRNFYKAYTAIGRALSLQGKYREAAEMFEKGRSLGGDVPSILAALGHNRSLAGDRAGAVALLEELRAMSGQRYAPTTCFALIHVGLGEKERALDWLELGCERRELPLANIGVHPIYDELRSAPRFQALLARIGLPKRVRGPQ